MRAPAASSMLLMRLTWAGVILLPLPAYGVLLWLANANLASSDDESAALLRVVEPFGVGRDLAIFAAFVLAVAWVLPRILHRRAIERLRRRARTEIDPDHGGTYRASPSLVQRLPPESAAIDTARARFAVRSAATLGMIAVLELAVFLRMASVKSFHCWGGGMPVTVYVPSPREHLVLIGLIVAFTALHVPRRASIVAPLRDLLEKPASV